MKTLFVLALLLSGCGAADPSAGVAPAGASWMHPEAQGRDLLYVASIPYDVDVYTYPQGKMVGALSGFMGPRGLCSNAGGDVFVTETYDVKEFAHGGDAPIATLSDPYGTPQGCSVDPASGKLAVVTSTVVAVYRAESRRRWHLERGHPIGASLAYCAYDTSGDLFVNGRRGTGESVVLELPKGATEFETLSLQHGIAQPGNLEWSAGVLAIEDESDEVIYRFTIRKGNAALEGVTYLKDVKDVTQFWIQDGTLIGPDFARSLLDFWSYPRGGKPARTIAVSDPNGVTVSLARK